MTMDLATIYETTRSSWRPSPDDNLSNAWFYSAFEGMKAVCNAINPEFFFECNYLLHEAICLSQGKDLALIVKCIRIPETPKKPEQRYSSDYEPTYDENRPREMFAQQFKAKFPGKRINSRFASEKWEEVKAKAEEYAQTEYKARFADWQGRELRRAEEHAIRVRIWEANCKRVEEIGAFVATINVGS